MDALSHVLFFLLTSLITALVTSLIRLDGPRQIARETYSFFATITVGIGVFCVVVYALEWIFIRPLH
ncbi:MAG: hypothetical protein O7J95_12740 [Planctomycetota bacterium]|nr:hypothetical protein [Planctomycetota bacterium]